MDSDFSDLQQIYAPAALAQAPGPSKVAPPENVGGIRQGQGFASYPTPEAGITAAYNLVQHRIASAPQGKLNLLGLIGGLTPEGALPSDADAADRKRLLALKGGWAPASDRNDPVGYAQGLGTALGLDPYKDTLDPSDPDQMSKLVYGIAKQEHGAKAIPSPDLFSKVVGGKIGASAPGPLDDQTFADLKALYPNQGPEAAAPVQPVAPAPGPVPSTLGPGVKSETAADTAGPAGQYNGAWREPAIAGSGVLEGLAGFHDMPGNLLELLGGKLGVGPQTTALARQGLPWGFGGPAATPALQGQGLVENPALSPQGTGERVLQEGAQGVGGALPFAVATGGASVVPTLLAGGAGNVAGQEGGPSVAGGLKALGVPQGVADVAGPMVASVPGALAGGSVGGMLTRGLGAAGEGPLAALGAAAPGNTLSTTINPGMQDLAQAATKAGIRVPSQYLAEDQAALPPVPAEALKQTWGDVVQKMSNSLGLNKRTLYEGDVDTAKAKAGQVMDTAIANSTTPLSQVDPQGWGDLVTRLYNIRDQMGLTPTATASSGPVSEAATRLKPVFDDLEKTLSSPTDLTGETYTQLTNKGSKLALAQSPGASGDTKYFASQIRDALNDAVSPVMGADVKATFDQARMNYKNAMVLDPAIRASDSGIPNLTLARNAVNKQYSGFIGADNASPGLGTAMRVVDHVPLPTAEGGVPASASAQIPPGHLGTAAGILGASVGLNQAAEHLPTIIHAVSQNPALAVAGGAGAGALGALAYGANRLGQGLNTARGAFMASPTGGQTLLDILSGKAQAPPGWLQALTQRGALGASVAGANQPPQ